MTSFHAVLLDVFDVRYFKQFMDDLSAKVFRTYNASFTLQAELNRFEVKNRSSYSQDRQGRQELMPIVWPTAPSLDRDEDRRRDGQAQNQDAWLLQFTRLFRNEEGESRHSEII